MKIKNWEIISIAESAYRHGQGYAQANIYRHVGKYAFKCPEAVGLPDYVIQLPIEEHQFLANVYRHAFRAGLKGA